MKNKIFSLLAVFVVLATISCSQEEQDQVMPSARVSSVLVKASFRGWSKAGNCLQGYGDCALAIVDNPFNGQVNMAPVLLSLDGTKLTIDNTINKRIGDGRSVTFDSSSSLPASISNSLGRQSITIVAGNYLTDYTTNAYGQITVDVR